MVRTRNWPVVQGIWRIVLNVTAIDPRTVEYLNGDRHVRSKTKGTDELTAILDAV